HRAHRRVHGHGIPQRLVFGALVVVAMGHVDDQRRAVDLECRRDVPRGALVESRFAQMTTGARPDLPALTVANLAATLPLVEEGLRRHRTLEIPVLAS